MRKIFLRTVHHIVWMALLLVDMSVNVASGGKVETISSRAGRARDNGKAWGCALCDMLDDIQPNHCANAQKNPTGGI